MSTTLSITIDLGYGHVESPVSFKLVRKAGSAGPNEPSLNVTLSKGTNETYTFENFNPGEFTLNMSWDTGFNNISYVGGTGNLIVEVNGAPPLNIGTQGDATATGGGLMSWLPIVVPE